MATRALNVIITGDSRGINKVLDQTESRTHKWGLGMAKGFAVAGAAAAGGLAVGLKKSADAAIEAENAQSKMVTQLKAAGVSYKAHAKQIDEVIQKTSKLSGLDDEDLQNSFTNIVRVTGDVNKSLKLTGLAADFARAKHMDVAKAGELVGKVAGGNTGILSRYGITVQKGATAQEALALLQKKFAGQAEAYGKTTAGAMDRAGVASENLGEIVGAKITPLLAKGANALVDLVDASGQLGGPIRKATGAIADAYNTVARAVRKFARDNREDIQQVINAVKNYGRFVKAVITDVVIPVFKRLLPVIKGELEGIITVLRGVIRIISGIINGDWALVWKGLKDIPAGIIKALKAALKGLWQALRDGIKALVPLALKAAENIGKAILNGIIDGIKSAPGAIAGAIGGLIPGGGGPAAPGRGPYRKIGDGIGRQIGASLGVIPDVGGFSAGLHGADPRMRPVASIASRFGLGISAGRTDHSKYTTSGNLSYHGSGEALDEAGSPSGMLAFARYMVNKFGGRIAELIHTPLGFSINNGVRVPPIDAGAHYDHVHVALDLGRPGVGIGDGPGKGDGLGKFQATSYGPPWGGIQGTGVTATGVNLKGNPHRYGVAVDPSVIRLGSKLKIWPNPFGYRGAFTAFDTGGAIKGHRLDFYDWRGRKAQMGWGFRSVNVSTAGGGSSGGGAHHGPGMGVFAGGGGGGGKPHLVGPLLDSIEAAGALADLTPGTADDITAGDQLVRYWEGKLAKARKSGDPVRIAEAARNLKSARDARSSLNPDATSSGGSGSGDGGVADAIAALTAEMKRTREANDRLVSTQGPAIVNAVVAAVNGSIGGKVGLGFQGIRSPAGDVAGL